MARQEPNVGITTWYQIVSMQGWLKQPLLAFIWLDFTFWDKGCNKVSSSILSETFQQAEEVWIQFCHNKSWNKHGIQKFTYTQHQIMCPVVASMLILHRAKLLCILDKEPIRVFWQKRKAEGYAFLKNTDVMDKLELCIFAPIQTNSTHTTLTTCWLWHTPSKLQQQLYCTILAYHSKALPLDYDGLLTQ